VSSAPAINTKRAFRFQELSLVVVILVLGALLTVFGGKVKVPVIQKNAQGQWERVFITNTQGEQEAAVKEVNKFLNTKTLTQLAKDTSFVAIMAVGMTIVIIAGGIDLSVGAIYALAGVLAALFFNRYGPEGPQTTDATWVVFAGIAICIGAGALCGAINGGLIVALKVHPFIITLGTMTIFRGIAFVITNAQSVGSFPSAFRALIRWPGNDDSDPNQLSLTPLLVMIFVTILGAIFLRQLAAGRRVYAVGGNEVASRYSGIRVERVKFAVFFLAGLAAGISALLAIGYYGGASSGDGRGYELNVIAAAVVGGASLSGGKGSALGALLGALIIQMITTGIVILGIDQNYSEIIIGSVVIVAVVLDQLQNWLARRRLSAEPLKQGA
jgi:ribose/xylose/arabinose/galactoside ABC-type transport system permease subunit